EKRTITRYSPSQNALCHAGSAAEDATPPAPGAAFYPLPSGRLCVAVSCSAGSEPTGRGGQRVYTHNVVFDREAFARCHYNPFAVVRAMAEAGLTRPELTPPPVLDELELNLSDQAMTTPNDETASMLSPAWCCHLLDGLLAGRSMVVHLAATWMHVAETVLMGVPGPRRIELSFGAGLRFSVGRCHRLSILRDDGGKCRMRIAGKPVQYIDATRDEPAPAPASSWFAFVQRLWRQGDLTRLGRRTSLPFGDASDAALERIGRLYNDTDAIPDTPVAGLLATVAERVRHPREDIEADIAAEFIVRAQQDLLVRLEGVTGTDARKHWNTLCEVSRESVEGRLFAQPLLETMLAAARSDHPLVALEMALKLVRSSSQPHAECDHQTLLDALLAEVAEWADSAKDDELDALPRLVERWRDLRPSCAIVDRLHRRCEALAALDTGR
ncbi:MAG: hypothetical protein ACE5EX_07680, partial [Phycisphaerae bacterium]